MIVPFDFGPPAVPLPVHVIIDQIPVAPGMPAWETALISAGVGALFAIATSLLMESVKPRLERSRSTKIISKHLALEIINNANTVETAIEFLLQAKVSSKDNEHLKELASLATQSVKHPIFDSFISDKIDIVNEIDTRGTLPLFYDRIDILHGVFRKFEDLDESIEWAIEASDMARSYMMEKNIFQNYADNRWLKFDRQKANARGVDWSVDPMKPSIDP